jgi:hypothetical protein
MVEVPDAVPPQIEELAKVCREFVKEALGFDLDYTPETLPLLDHYVRNKAKYPDEEVRDLLTPPLGAYFGEVVRRSQPGVRWHAPEPDYSDYRIEFEGFFLHFNPLGVALEVMTDEDAEGFGAHFQILDEAQPAIEQALATNDSVSEDDYYSFTVRYETLELVISILLGLESRHSAQPRRFSREVYRAASGVLPGVTKGSLS